jgi:hypothetical protein
MYAFRGASDASTAALQDQMYLCELHRQATIFDSSLHAAMVSALVTDDVDECWRHLQGALFAAVVVIRLIKPTATQKWGLRSANETKAIAHARAKRLRELVGLPEPGQQDMALYQLRSLRNAMEHVDERLDHIADASIGSLSDWYLSGGTVFMRDATSQTAPLGLRSFDPTAGVLIVDDQMLDLFQLDIEMLKLRMNATEAIGEAATRIVGRCQFGGVIHGSLGSAEQRLRALQTWEARRAELLAIDDQA